MKVTVETLGSLCTLTMGKTPSRSDSRYWDSSRTSKNVWITIADMTKSANGILTDSKEYLSDEGSKMFAKIKEGTLLLSFKLSIGKLAVAGIELQTNEAIMAMNDLNEELIQRDYLYYYLYGFDWNKALEGRSKVKGNTLNKQILEALPVPLPSPREQQEIVEKLDKAFKEIDDLEKFFDLKEDKANQLWNSFLNSAFTFSDAFAVRSNPSGKNKTPVSCLEVSLKEICDVDWGNTKLTKASYVDGGRFLAVSAAGADGFINHFEHEANVPVLSAIGAQCGRMFFPGTRFTAIKNTITLTPKKMRSEGKFLFYLLNYVELPKRGAGQPFISKGDIEEFRVTIPESLEAQQEIVEHLDKAFTQIELIRANVDSKRKATQRLRQSLLHQAFSNLEEVA